MADFNLAYPKTSANEGYYVSQEYWRAHKNQYSGETYMGVDRIANPSWSGWPIIDSYKAQHGPIAYNTRLPQSLGLEPLVKQYAKEKYWDTIRGDEINDQDIAQMIFEQKWGGYSGIKGVQNVINTLTPDQIAVDGSIGNDTLDKINSLPPNQLYQALYDDRMNWINTTGARLEPTAVSGWTTRLQGFQKTLADVALQASDAANTAEQAAAANPIITVVAILFLISGCALAYYQFFYVKNTTQLLSNGNQ